MSGTAAESVELLVAGNLLDVAEVLGVSQAFHAINQLVMSKNRFEKAKMTVALSRLAGLCQVEGRKIVNSNRDLAEFGRTPYRDFLSAEVQRVFDKERRQRLNHYRGMILAEAALMERDLRDLEVLSAMDSTVVKKEAQELLEKASGGARAPEALYCSSVQ
jgi:hypothetical protein